MILGTMDEVGTATYSRDTRRQQQCCLQVSRDWDPTSLGVRRRPGPRRMLLHGRLDNVQEVVGVRVQVLHFGGHPVKPLADRGADPVPWGMLEEEPRFQHSLRLLDVERGLDRSMIGSVFGGIDRTLYAILCQRRR